MHSFKSRDEEEVAGYAECIQQVFMHHNDIPLSENYIKQLHSTLLKYSKKDTRHKGHYKTLDNHVEAFGPDGKSLGIVFKTATPFETPFKMQELVIWTQQAFSEKLIHPLLIIANFSVVFLAIHPFQDGNGRLSRILTTLLLLRNNYTYAPYSSLENVIEANKDLYYLALRRTQKTLEENEVDWEPWFKFFLGALKKQKDQLELKLSKQAPEVTLSVLDNKIVAFIRKNGRAQITELLEETKANRSTLKKHLQLLCSRAILSKQGNGPATWYILHKSQT